MLLIFGVFLVVVSASVLVAFNWASFSPVLQFGMLAGVCGGLWGLGGWLSHKSARAGLGLQVAGGLLVPIVAFALSRPGLLDLLPRQSWLLTAGISVVIYALATWRLRQPIFMVAACISLINTVLASVGFVAEQWLPASLILTLTGFVIVSHALRDDEPMVSASPRWIAHLATPITLVVVPLMHALGFGVMDLTTVGLTLWAGSAYYALALILDRRQRWAWPAAWLPVIALFVTLIASHASNIWWSIGPAALILTYVVGAVVFDPHTRSRSVPIYLAALKAASAMLLKLIDTPALMRWSIPVLLIACAVVVVGYHLGRFAWLKAHQRSRIPAIALALAVPLLYVWLAQFNLPYLDHSRLTLVFTTLALLSAAWLHRTRAAYWTPVGLVWGGVGLLVLIGNLVVTGGVIPAEHLGALSRDPVDGIGMLVLAATTLYLSLRFRHFAAGFLAVGLAWLGVNHMAVAWQIDGNPISLSNMGLVWCGLALAFVIAAYVMRRLVSTRFALPYALAGAGLPLLAVLAMAGDGMRITGVWWMIVALWLLQAHYFRQRWVVALAMLAADMALLRTAALLWPTAEQGNGGILLMVAMWLQVFATMILRKTRHATGWRWSEPYIAAALTAVWALVLGAAGWATLAYSALGLAALCLVLTAFDRNEVTAWATLAFLMLGISAWHASIGWRWTQSAAMHIWVLVGAMALGGLINRIQRGAKIKVDSVWTRPLLWGALIAGSIWGIVALCTGLAFMQYAEFALACLAYGALLAVLAVRRRSAITAVFAPVFMVAAVWGYALSQSWSDAQWFVTPIGLYLLCVAAALRYFKSTPAATADNVPMQAAAMQSAQVLEWIASILLLGVTAMQMLTSVRADSQLYAAALCGESLLLAGYGTLRQLRVPFIGGSVFFIGSVLWLGLDPLLALNKWVLFGALGLLMIAAYVVLEHGRVQVAALRQRLSMRLHQWQ